jgi:Rad52/22 family double-strand break repair protein
MRADPMTSYPDLFSALAAPFDDREIRTRTQGGKTLSYITARVAMNRLDSVLGPEKWWDDFTPGEDSVLCRLTVRLPDGSTLTKADAGGYAGMADPGDDDKSGYADSFKRAAVKFGVGRYLYRDGVPSFARPAPPAPAPVVGRDTRTKLAPRNGQELLAWMSRQSRRWGFGLEDEVIAWGKSKGLPGRVVAWPVAAINGGYSEACRLIRARRASVEGVPFSDLAGFRIWLERSGLDGPAHAFGDEARYPASTLKWSFDQAVACYRALSEDMAETAGRP